VCCSCAGWRLPTPQAFVLALPPSGKWRFASALVHAPGFKTPQKWQFSWATFLVSASRPLHWMDGWMCGNFFFP